MACSGCPRCEPRLDELPKDVREFTAEDIQVLALRLSDAREDLNDALKETEGHFTRLRVPPGRVPMVVKDSTSFRAKAEQGYLVWNGIELLHQVGDDWRPLLTQGSTDARMETTKHLEALYEECTGRKVPE